jgi:hypothetical protein
MNTEMETRDAAGTGQSQVTKPDRKPRTRIPHERSRFVHATNDYLRKIGGEFDSPNLLRLEDFTQVNNDEFVAICQAVPAAIARVFGGVVEAAPAQNVDAMMDGFVHWFQQRPVIFHRTAAQLAAIRRKLIETGGELIPTYALSCAIKKPKTGRLIWVNNEGQECKP